MTEIKSYIKKKIDEISSKYDYKLHLYTQKNDLLAIQAYYRRGKINHRIALNLTLENTTTKEAKLKNNEVFRIAKVKLKRLDKKMQKKVAGEFIEKTFLEFFEMCIDKPTTTGKIRTDGTKKNWRRVLKHLQNFLKQKYDADDISFDLVNFAFFSELHSWLVNNFKQYSANSIWSIIKRFIKYAALEDRIEDSNLLLKIQNELRIKKPTIIRTEKDYLTLEEIQKMMNYCYYPRYKIPFVFNCYVGLRISDLKRLTWNNFNREFSEISIIEKKTGKLYNAPIHPFVTDLLNKLYEKKTDSDLIFDLPIDDWKTNKHIKKWAKLSGIDKKMSSHIMRRTFLNLMEWSGVSLTSSSKLLNHSSVKITEQYYLANDKKILKNELEKLPMIEVKI